MDPVEMDEGRSYIGYREALELVHAHSHPVGIEVINISESMGRIAAGDIVARISNPSCDVSLKDGFAVRSSDITEYKLRGLQP